MAAVAPRSRRRRGGAAIPPATRWRRDPARRDPPAASPPPRPPRVVARVAAILVSPQVHFGGKRARHPFRALYDAFGRRVDYGDGDFDLASMWPSELIQDDVAGILLRIAPHRDPAETAGTWQRYDDREAGVSYYYNPVSGEGTYEEPAAVAEHRNLSAYEHAKNWSEQDQIAYDQGYDQSAYYDDGAYYGGGEALGDADRSQTAVSRKEGVHYSPIGTPDVGRGHFR